MEGLLSTGPTPSSFETELTSVQIEQAWISSSRELVEGESECYYNITSQGGEEGETQFHCANCCKTRIRGLWQASLRKYHLTITAPLGISSSAMEFLSFKDLSSLCVSLCID